MRGHVGYKIPRQPARTIRLSFVAFDALTTGLLAPQARLSFIGFDALTYVAPSRNQRITHLGFDALTTSAPATTGRVSHIGIDAMTYTRQAPAAPTAVFGTGDGTSIILTWRPAKSIGEAPTNHTVQYKVSTDTAWTTVTTNSGLPTATITGLTLGTLYTFKVAATNGVGTSAYSATADAAPMSTVNSFSATMYYTTDWYWAEWHASGDSVLGVDPTFPTQMAGSTEHYFDFWPLDYDSGETFFQFVTGINDVQGTNRRTACASTAYLETGANVASCEYSYQFQRRAPSEGGWQADWHNIYTYPVTFNFGNTGTLPRPRYPQELAVTYTADLFYTAGVRYEHRCVVTRKSDGAKYVTHTRTITTGHNINY
jgi:hypothetical protein